MAGMQETHPLVQRVDGLEERVTGLSEDMSAVKVDLSSVKTEVHTISQQLSSLAQAINELGRVTAQKGRTDWQTLATWAGLIMAIMAGYQHLSLTPLRNEDEHIREIMDLKDELSACKLREHIEHSESKP